MRHNINTPSKANRNQFF